MINAIFVDVATVKIYFFKVSIMDYNTYRSELCLFFNKNKNKIKIIIIKVRGVHTKEKKIDKQTCMGSPILVLLTSDK